MLKVIFIKEQSRIDGGIVFGRYARVISKEEELGFSNDWKETLFVEEIGDDGENAKVNGVAVFETEDADILHANGALKLIDSILRKADVQPEAICSTSLKRLIKISKEVENGEFELKVLQGNCSNEVLCYGWCGEHDSTLLVAYGRRDEIAK